MADGGSGVNNRLLLGAKERNLPLPVYKHLLTRLYDYKPSVLLGSAFTLAVLGSLIAARAADLWIGILTLAAVCGTLLLFRLVRTPPDFQRLSLKDTLAAEVRFWIVALASTAAIGALCARATVASDSPLLHLLSLTLAMAVMAMLVRNCFRLRLVAAQLIAITAPGTIALLSRDAPEYWILAGGGIVFSLLIYRIASAMYQGEYSSVIKDTELTEQNRRFESALSNMAQGLCMFDQEGRLLVCNEKYLNIYGFSVETVHPGVTLNEIVKHSIEIGNHSGMSAEELEEEFVELITRGNAANFLNVLDDGRVIALSHQKMPSGGWVTTHEDVTERMQAQEQITYLARHDALTELPNRVFFRERLSEALERVSSTRPVAVLCLDLDRFKPVNDTLGHPVGDALLKQVAERLKHCVRETDTVARIGGDEFAIVLLNAEDPKGVEALADRLVSSLGRPFYVGSHQITIGASVGISFAPRDALEADRLLKNADLALYQAKTEGRDQYQIFKPELDRKMQSRRTLELDLRRAIADGEFELHYQPLVNVATGGITGFEALLRWNHPTRGVILPGEFISLAEDLGLIVPIGEWVLRQACAAATSWPENISVAVNLSPAQFKGGDLVRTVTSALAVSGIAPSRLELEITEGVLLADSQETLATLHALRKLGVRFAMDDFGTGYSSLSYLRSFPFNKIKIDQSFVQDIFSGTQALSIIRAVADLGKNLGMSTTAEGIETAEQLEQLRAEGCSEAQGYHLGRPMDAASALEFLKRSSRGRLKTAA